MLGGLLLWLGLLPLGALAVLDTNLGNQTIEWVSELTPILAWTPSAEGTRVSSARRCLQERPDSILRRERTTEHRPCPGL